MMRLAHRAALLSFVAPCWAASLRAASAGSNIELPGVGYVLTKAEDMVGNFTAQAAAMQKSIEKKQSDARERLAVKKRAYESQLVAQEEDSNATRATIAALKEKFASLRKRNEMTKKEAEDLRQSNRVMRESLSAIEKKIHAAKDFVNDSLVRTDDHKSLSLRVLEPPEPQPTLKYFLSVAGNGADARSKKDVALLQQSGRAVDSVDDAAQSSGPAYFMTGLSRTLEDWTSAEQEGEAKLEANFKTAYEVGRAKQKALLKEQDAVNGTVLAEKALMEKLGAAKDELWKTHAELKERLHGINTFGEKVAKAAREAQEAADASSKQLSRKVEGKVANETKMDIALNLAAMRESTQPQGKWFSWR